jgi:hypothetical protein
MVPLKIFIDISLKPHYGPGVDSASNKMCTRNISREVKATFPPSCDECLEIWEPQPPGKHRACNRPVQGLFYLLYNARTYAYFL